MENHVFKSRQVRYLGWLIAGLITLLIIVTYRMNRPTFTNSNSPVYQISEPLPSSTATKNIPTFIKLLLFEKVWEIIDEDYVYQDFNGLDWDTIHMEVRDKIERGITDKVYYELMEEMVFRLGDGHSRFTPPSDNSDFVGIGIYHVSVPERQRSVIMVVYPNSAADDAGLKSRDSILAVDDKPILENDGSIKSELLEGPEGTEVVLTVQTAGQIPRQVEIIRRKEGVISLSISYESMITTQGKHIGYVLLPYFYETTINDQVAEALKHMAYEKPLDGLILDLRMNKGGSIDVMRDVLAFFTYGTLGFFTSRHGVEPFEIPELCDIEASSWLPLVVLIGSNTSSAGELFAGVLGDIERGYLIGETTAGNLEKVQNYNGIDGSTLWLADAIFHPVNHPDETWEGTGVSPDMLVRAYWDEFTLENDPAVHAALDYFDR